MELLCDGARDRLPLGRSISSVVMVVSPSESRVRASRPLDRIPGATCSNGEETSSNWCIFGGLSEAGAYGWQRMFSPRIQLAKHADRRLAQYGGAEQRQALLNRMHKRAALLRARALFHFWGNGGLGYRLECLAWYRGNQGLDLVFSRGNEYAVVETTGGGSLAMLKTDTNGLAR